MEKGLAGAPKSKVVELSVRIAVVAASGTGVALELAWSGSLLFSV
jgi:hypothetical protein